MRNDSADFMTTADVARRIDRTTERVRQIAVAGELRVAATTVSGTRLFRREDVAAYLERRDGRRAAA